MGFSDDMVQRVWEKGCIAGNNDPQIWRKDQCGAWICRSKYGDRKSQYGWEIDHISPGGADILSNLRPLQWQNNVDKSDGRLKGYIVAQGQTNIDTCPGRKKF